MHQSQKDNLFGGLFFVGADSVFSETNDTGPDDANHAMDGIVILSDGGGCEIEGASIYDVAPTLLDWMKIPVPAELQGRSLINR